MFSLITVISPSLAPFAAHFSSESASEHVSISIFSFKEFKESMRRSLEGAPYESEFEPSS